MSRIDVTDVNQKVDISEIRPLADQMLVEIIRRDRRASGIIIPGGEKSESTYAKVLAHGPGLMDESARVHPLGVKVGDTVIIMDYAGARINLVGGDKYRVIRDQGIWAKITLDKNLMITECSPYSDHILVRMAKDEKTLSGRLFIPENPQTKFRIAEVLPLAPVTFTRARGHSCPWTSRPAERSSPCATLALRCS